MSQALYRKYRSKSLNEIFGQEHITGTLKNAIEQGRVSHAYLLTGPRGVGKTSIARILAHQLNGLPYVNEDSHLDIIEIDAASTGGVDEVRELREKIYIAPTSGKYKVYIIDEVHMMSTAAFNALLKTLEEPPAHVIFILATTEAHKLPSTIISRTQRFTFRPIPTEIMTKHLRSIADKEKIDITNEALTFIADHSEGSFRDSIGLLDQAAGLHSPITQADLENLLGIPSLKAIQQLMTFLEDSDVQNMVSSLTELQANGYQAAVVAKQLGRLLREILIGNQVTRLSKPELVSLLNRLLNVPTSHNPDQLLELILIEATLSGSTKSLPKTLTTQNVGQEKKVKAASDGSTQKSFSAQDTTTNVTEVIPNNSQSTTITDQDWQAALETLKKQYNTLYGIIKLARADFASGKVKLTFNYVFHQKRANDAKNKDILSKVLHDLTGQIIIIECFYEKKDPSLLSVTSDEQTYENEFLAMPLDAISNIFGGGELLES